MAVSNWVACWRNSQHSNNYDSKFDSHCLAAMHSLGGQLMPKTRNFNWINFHTSFIHQIWTEPYLWTGLSIHRSGTPNKCLWRDKIMWAQTHYHRCACYWIDACHMPSKWSLLNKGGWQICEPPHASDHLLHTQLPLAAPTVHQSFNIYNHSTVHEYPLNFNTWIYSPL